jgi:sulfur carrier protein ThiS
LLKDTPPRGNVKIISCETLEEAESFAEENKKLFEYIRIYNTSDMKTTVVEYVNGKIVKKSNHHN